ncbi:RagB/SusD family nutrient uptake outer membrane protein [Pedobacter sp. UBA5917]|uniref:RagB/SusD family nutrient uptake outer membrane protein n=1 Tax=Pedobacter sp. UBA5917 TaxID=1947061 RepID=UPI0025E37CF7|nr:RagB/SusD family nutrient uptake outer membrane protein [Pedobacter sp. UBA5917]
MKTIKSHIFIAFVLFATLFSGCKKFLEIPLPTDRFATEGAYLNDNSTGAVLTGIFSTAAGSILYNGANTLYETIGFRTSLYADDLTQIQAASVNSIAATTSQFYLNGLTSTNSTQWITLYRQVYNCNLTIENVESHRSNLSRYNQWMGEALFMRAFSYFDLVNLYGDVPLALSSDYNVTNFLPRAPKAQVYAQMAADLIRAESLLGETYLDGLSATTPNRTRPNKFAAAALLARVYLYMENYAGAEAEATKVINNSTLYQLLPPANVFLANSLETIWAIAPTTGNVVRDYYLYTTAPAVNATQVALANISPGAMSASLLNSFEANDQRIANWTVLKTTTTAPVNGQFYYPAKYKSVVNGTEFLIQLRLAEQFLIRAEARLKQNNNVTAAVQDINVVRQRARPTTPADALPDYPSTISPDACMDAILKERRTELFSESGHRFYDLKRTGRIDAVMTAAATVKGSTWASWKQIWPIPLNDIQLNPNLTQAPNYQ